jgi:hypothetical protein
VVVPADFVGELRVAFFDCGLRHGKSLARSGTGFQPVFDRQDAYFTAKSFLTASLRASTLLSCAEIWQRHSG